MVHDPPLQSSTDQRAGRPKKENTKAKEMTRQTNLSPGSQMTCPPVDRQSVLPVKLCALYAEKEANRLSTNIDKARLHVPLDSYTSSGGSKCLCENKLYHLVETQATSVNHSATEKICKSFCKQVQASTCFQTLQKAGV